MGSDQGHAAVELALAVGLLMIPAALVVLGFGPWSERAVLAESMATESARAAVLELSVESGDVVASEMAANYGLTTNSYRIGWCGNDALQGSGGDCGFERGDAVSAEVAVWVPLVVTPWGEIGGLWISRTHVELVDLYRSLP